MTLPNRTQNRNMSCAEAIEKVRRDTRAREARRAEMGYDW